MTASLKFVCYLTLGEGEEVDLIDHVDDSVGIVYKVPDEGGSLIQAHI